MFFCTRLMIMYESYVASHSCTFSSLIIMFQFTIALFAQYTIGAGLQRIAVYF